MTGKRLPFSQACNIMLVMTGEGLSFSRAYTGRKRDWTTG